MDRIFYSRVPDVRLLAGIAVILFSFAGFRESRAQWSSNPGVNTPISTAANTQYDAAIVSDGSGGAIITWNDNRSGNNDIYAQRINSSGAVQWTADGVAICAAANGQTSQNIISDGAGGAIITWQDARSGFYDIYAQRINSSGIVQWTANGVAICAATGHQYQPTVVSEGSGGAIITWYDYRGGATSDIYAQRINSSGAVQWTANGVAISTAANDQNYPTVVGDDAGGAIITWQDYRVGATSDIYVQRVNSSGGTQWTANGVAICTAAGNQTGAAIVSDGAGGAIITWSDIRGAANYDIYAQRVNSSGSVQWTIDGVAISTAASEQYIPAIVSYGAGGAIITWRDYRSSTNWDIYAQRVNSSGIVQWTANGVAITTTTSDQFNSAIASDGSADAIITWQDSRSGAYDIYAQRINSSGAVQWTADGVAISTAAGAQESPAIAGDGSGGAIITWQDMRSGTSNDVYAQRTDRYGYLGDASPRIVSVKDVINDQGGKVTVMWNRSYVDTWPNQTINEYTIWRGVKPGALQAGFVVLGRDEFFANQDNKAGARAYLKLPLSSSLADTIYWEYIASVSPHWMIGYSYNVPTASDSGPQGIPLHYFMVIAQASDPLTYWESQSASGYSIDNLPPFAPLNLAGSQAGYDIALHWNPNTEPDLYGYKVFRSSAPGFDPDTMTAIGTTSDTSYADLNVPPGMNYYYAIRALDIHDNKSPKSNEVTFAVVGVAENPRDLLPRELELWQNSPNPLTRTTVISYALPARQYVSLKVFNVLGREVATLVDGMESAGMKTATFDAGNLPSGIYTYRLSVLPDGTGADKAFVSVKKMLVIR